MRGIYQHAFETLAWLGQDMEHSKEAFSILKALGMDSPESGEELLMRTAELNTHPCRDLKGPGWAAVAKFMGRPYWQRTWIIQEVALSQRMIILWGQEDMRIETLYGAMVTIREHKYDFTGFFEGYKDIQGLLHIWRQTARTPEAHTLGIEEALSWSCQSLASEQRDKIFGLLGTSKDGKDLIPHPDYLEPIDSVLRKITAKILVNESDSTYSVPSHGVVNIICLGPPVTPRRINLPSWVVDWVALWASPRGIAWSSRYSKSLTSMGTSMYQACGKSVVSVRLSTDELTLVCPRYKFDTIRALCKKHPKVEGLNSDCREVAATRDTENSIQNNVYGSEIGLHEAIWRSLVQDRGLKNKTKNAPASFAQHFQSVFPDDARKLYIGWSETMAEYIYAVGDFEIYGRKVRNWHDIAANLHISGDYGLYDERLLGRTPIRQFLSAANGD